MAGIHLPIPIPAGSLKKYSTKHNLNDSILKTGDWS